MRVTSRRPRLGSGGAPPPALPDLIAADEGPMRRDLLRQIAALEQELTRFEITHCSEQATETSPRRGPAVLSTAALEQIRDELLGARGRLHDGAVARARAGWPDDLAGRRSLLARLLRRG
jgi:hypothetical protein